MEFEIKGQKYFYDSNRKLICEIDGLLYSEEEEAVVVIESKSSFHKGKEGESDGLDELMLKLEKIDKHSDAEIFKNKRIIPIFAVDYVRSCDLKYLYEKAEKKNI